MISLTDRTFLFLFVLFWKTGPSCGQWEWMHDDSKSLVNPIQVYDIFPEDNSDLKATISLTSDETSLSTPYTLCFWIFRVYFNTSEMPITLKQGGNFLQLIILQGRLELYVNQRCPIPSTTKKLEAQQWYHLCISISNELVSLQFDEEQFEYDLNDNRTCKKPIIGNDTLSVDLGYDNNGFKFTGMIGDIRLFPRQLTQSEITSLDTCDEEPGNHIMNFNVTIRGGSVQKRELIHMCEKPPSTFLALFDSYANYTESLSFCTTMKGTLVNDDYDHEFAYRQVTRSEDVTVDSVQFWIDEKHDENYGFALNIVRGIGHQMLKFSKSAKLKIVACVLPLGTPYLLKVGDSKTFKSFPMRGKLVFISMNDMVLSMDKCPKTNDSCLNLKEMGHSVFYAPLTMEMIPVGRRVWKCPNTDNEINATLSHCQQDEFTCSDGQCISLDLKCDGQTHCKDKSDESDNCYFTDVDPSYQKNLCPDVEPIIGFEVNIDGVHAVSMEKNEIEIKLTIETSWEDSRLTFVNLHDENVYLDRTESDLLWYPQLSFKNARYKDNLNMQLDLGTNFLLKYFVTNRSRGQESLRDSYEVREYPGNEVQITRVVTYVFTFNCEYNYTLYPFDTQECRIFIKLEGKQGCNPKMDNESTIVYSKKSTISMYSISEAVYCQSSEGDVLIIHMLLTRNFDSYLLTIFIPCIILCLLSTLTLTHFELTNFTDRITVTLSLLIVLASIFSQVSSSLPESPDPKLVDMFFAYCIIRVSFAFFIHCCIQRSIRVHGRKKPSTDANTSYDPIVNIYHKMAWLTENVQMEEKKASRFDWPKIINVMGLVITIFSDVSIATIFTYMAIYDTQEKRERFGGLTKSTLH